MPSPLVVLGGTFDPVHHAHLRTALEIQQLLGRDTEVQLLPCGDPRHRAAPHASARHRLEMLRLAVSFEPGLVVSDREVNRTGATYTVDTLIELREEEGPERPIIFVMGGDAFLSLPKWHRWVEIIQLAHIMVINRPNWSNNGQGELSELLRRHTATNLNELTELPSGRIAECALTQLDISSTQVRALIKDGQSPRFLIPDLVLDYIRSHHLYGSTDA
ncbi:nicotinate-nicotinamide nucleotide adenylyltransferase [Hahella sp. CCB-MM4]|uniref:nicotinate-nucleotide adenylyltransferase n=1 Tax=Hahella sp. (strain CCB-MM4) TaxID=1926491 RepID=UPI000B9B2448|nr:nicotinate-nucleotide adenylyltransferase [Hahella sp. CCB-MM4]OZG71954.1 nicotinate-nicotinamide nucleotide adenylyltransferase [Hahella sp. CCB-MM4]